MKLTTREGDAIWILDDPTSIQATADGGSIIVVGGVAHHVKQSPQTIDKAYDPDEPALGDEADNGKKSKKAA
jgi:hypothetical protein